MAAWCTVCNTVQPLVPLLYAGPTVSPMKEQHGVDVELVAALVVILVVVTVVFVISLVVALLVLRHRRRGGYYDN